MYTFTYFYIWVYSINFQVTTNLEPSKPPIQWVLSLFVDVKPVRTSICRWNWGCVELHLSSPYTPMAWTGITLPSKLLSWKYANCKRFRRKISILPIVAALSKAWVFGRLLARVCGFVSRRGHDCPSLVCVVCGRVDVSVMGWSLVQKSPAEYGAFWVWSWNLNNED
jgi:hypothetical protein